MLLHCNLHILIVGGGGLLDHPRGDMRPPAGASRGGMPPNSQFSPRQGQAPPSTVSIYSIIHLNNS